MARKTKEIRITSGTAETNRDFGKVYMLTEMSAYDAERWGADAFQGLVKAGVEVPDDLSGAGIVAIATMGLKALGGMPSETLHDLMDRMMAMVTHYPNPDRREISRGFGSTISVKLFDTDIEEISTRLFLRQELLGLHAGFLMAGVQSLAAPKAPALT